MNLNFSYRYMYMGRLIYRYGETNLCYGVIFKPKFLSDPSTRVYHI